MEEGSDRMTDKLEVIRDGIIRKAFPELINEDIQIEYKELRDACLEYGKFTSEGFHIEVDESLRTAPVDVINGGIAHELCHIMADKKRGLSEWLLRKSVRYRMLDERDTDLRTIIRGYGRELLAFLRYAETKGYPYYKEDGLSIREIEIIMK